jgi:Zn finger protein HypA/HybF involved in hydrogenase expression
MAETYFAVETLRAEYWCDNCDTAPMTAAGHVLMTDPPKYPHTCPNCGHKKNLDSRYPKIIYKGREHHELG